MGCYFDVYDETIEIKTESNYLQSQTRNQLEKCIRTKHTNENPHFFDIDEIFIEYINNHNEKLELYLVKCDFILVFDTDFYPQIKSDLHFFLTLLQSKKCLLIWIEVFMRKGYNFCHKYKLCITTKDTSIEKFL